MNGIELPRTGGSSSSCVQCIQRWSNTNAVPSIDATMTANPYMVNIFGLISPSIGEMSK